VNSRWLHRLSAARRLSFHFEVPDEHYVGLALYSRLPLEDARAATRRVVDAAVAATLNHNRRHRVHPRPPDIAA
jgi:hypothetical protein